MKFQFKLHLALVLLTSISMTNAHAGEVSGKVSVSLKDASGEWKNIEDASYAVVYVTGFEEGLKADAKKKYLDQDKKVYVPRVLAVTQGEKVIFRNFDDLYHNSWSLSESKKFDLGSFKNPETKSVVFDKPGLVNIFCNIHPTMIAYVLVLKNNSYMVTDKTGNFKLSGLPAGKHQLRVWYEGASPIEKVITVTDTSTQNIDLQVRGNKVPKNDKNKYGKDYAPVKDYP